MHGPKGAGYSGIGKPWYDGTSIHMHIDIKECITVVSLQMHMISMQLSN